MLTDLDELPKIELPNSLRLQIDKIKNQERNEDDINHYLINYELMKNQNNCYNNDVCYNCVYIFG